MSLYDHFLGVSGNQRAGFVVAVQYVDAINHTVNVFFTYPMTFLFVAQGQSPCSGILQHTLTRHASRIS